MYVLGAEKNRDGSFQHPQHTFLLRNKKIPNFSNCSGAMITAPTGTDPLRQGRPRSDSAQIFTVKMMCYTPVEIFILLVSLSISKYFNRGVLTKTQNKRALVQGNFVDSYMIYLQLYKNTVLGYAM